MLNADIRPIQLKAGELHRIRGGDPVLEASVEAGIVVLFSGAPDGCEPSLPIGVLLAEKAEAEEVCASVHRFAKSLGVALGISPEGMHLRVLGVGIPTAEWSSFEAAFRPGIRLLRAELRDSKVALRIAPESDAIFVKQLQEEPFHAAEAPRSPTEPAPDVALRKGPLKVLLVDDSQTAREMIKRALLRSGRFEIAGEASDGYRGIELLQLLKPDAVTIDLHMPGMNGLEFIEKMMEKAPTPAVVVTDLSRERAGLVLQALEAGAVEYLQKPSLANLPSFQQELGALLEGAVQGFKAAPRRKLIAPPAVSIASRFSLLAIGASTGGVEALRELLAQFSENVPPIVIVQHMPGMFTRAFAERLDSVCRFRVTEAKDFDVLERNHAYVAPGELQLKVERRGSELILRTKDDPPVNRFKPSVDYLFHSIAGDRITKQAAALLLTGMGNDGAAGLLTLRQGGALTIAQSAESCAVYGMPKAAVELGAAERVLPLEQMAEFLQRKAAAA